MAKLHSRGTAYFLLALMAAAMEMIFGWRASVMYEHFLASYVGFWELLAFRIVVFLGVAVGGYVLATHRQYGVEAVIDRMRRQGALKNERDTQVYMILGAIAVVVIHDWAGVIYTVFEGHSPDFISVCVTIGMCAFCLLPFLMGHMMLALAESIKAEKAEEYDSKLDKLDKETRIRAAEELVRRGEDRSAEERLTQGIKGLLPEHAQPKTRVLSESETPHEQPLTRADLLAFMREMQGTQSPLALPVQDTTKASQNGKH